MQQYTDPSWIVLQMLANCFLLLLLLLLLLYSSDECSYSTTSDQAHRSRELPDDDCCASTAYLSLWNQLMHHYFPPKNFTDHCWEPDSEIGTVQCRGSCFTLVEEIYERSKKNVSCSVEQHGCGCENERARERVSTHAVMRGCVNRFLLFGLDEDVRDALSEKSECRTTDRRLFHLVALTPNTDLVIMCSCTGSLCNYANMDHILSIAISSAPNAFLLILLLISHYAIYSLIIGDNSFLHVVRVIV
ncbi:unnamed protein product [Litomosoides sigmodontis]|uniref:Uncharacterized protein n=1 Tax=Litomosoides sigmodontis TaxID=42156 RepID=A0A3P6V212_LITSI|nr:unnamed protein product [Litomosoides sigmodontis]